MIIDLTLEEWKFLELIMIRALALVQIKDPMLIPVTNSDYRRAKGILEKLIKGKDDH